MLLSPELHGTAMSACCRVARMERDARDSAGRCAALEQEFPWIAGEKQLFGCASYPSYQKSPMQMPKQAPDHGDCEGSNALCMSCNPWPSELLPYMSCEGPLGSRGFDCV